MVCMELMATSLDRILSDTKNQPVPEPVIGKIACSVLDALNYLKEHHVTFFSIFTSEGTS